MVVIILLAFKLFSFSSSALVVPEFHSIVGGLVVPEFHSIVGGLVVPRFGWYWGSYCLCDSEL